MSKEDDLYNSNPNLLRANVKREITEEQIQEIIKCRDNIDYFCKKYMKIISLDEGIVPFKMWDFQKDLVKAFHKHRFVICKMPRQVGKTTTTVGYILHYIIFNANVNVGILANKGSTAREILSRLQLAYEQLPAFLKHGVVVWNKGNIEIENGSKVLATSTSASSVRGMSFNIIFLDELAHVQNNIAEEFFESTYPAISSGKTTKIIIVSTPKGLNWFYTLWEKAKKPKNDENSNDFIPIEVHWSQVPGRDEAWKKQTIANTSEDQFRQEYECEFIGSTFTLITASKLKQLMEIEMKIPIHSEEGLDVYEHTQAKHTYVITVDVSQGLGKDYSAFSVVDVSSLPYKQVAKYRDNKIQPLIYPGVIYNVAKKFNDAFVLIEINDSGQEVANILHYEFGYENLIKLEHKTHQGQRVSGGYKPHIQLGVRTTMPVKRIGCAHLKTLIENSKLLIWDADTIQELAKFSVNGNTYKAEEGEHDDLAMSLVHFSWLTNQRFFKENIDVDVRRIIQEEQLKLMDNDILPPIIIDDGINARDGFLDDDGDFWTVERRRLYPFDDLNYDWTQRI